MNHRDRVLNCSMKGLFVRYGLPAIFGMLVLQLYNLTDAVFVGKLIGPEAVGAIGIAYIAVLVNQIFFIVVGNGAGTLLSIALGGGDTDKCNRLAGDAIIYSLIPSVFYSLVMYFFAEQLVGLFAAGPQISDLTVRYLRVSAFGMPAVTVLASIHSLLRGEGFIVESTRFMTLSVLLNIVLDYLFIRTFNMNIEGAALATVISQFAGLALLASHYLRRKSVIRIEHIRLDHSLIPDILRNGSGQAFMHMSGIVFMAILYASLARRGGDQEIVILTASLRVWEYFFFVLLGASIGMQTVAGISFGAGNYERVKSIFRFNLVLGLGVSIVSWIMFMGLPETFLSWFISESAIVQSGITPFRLINSIFFLLGASSMMSMLFVAIGRGELSFFYVLLQQVIFFVPLVIIRPVFMGITGIWLTVPLSGLMSFAVQLILFSSVWKNLSQKIPAETAKASALE